MIDLSRFIEIQENDYPKALSEIKNGKKLSHWMWYIFPQIAGLGYSSISKFYAIKDIDEAKAFLSHDILGARLKEITKALLNLDSLDIKDILGSPDDLKLQSCMTLFSKIELSEENIFQEVLDTYFNGSQDSNTLALIP